MNPANTRVFTSIALRQLWLEGAFLESHPGAWLIWAPVRWKPAFGAGETIPRNFSVNVQRQGAPQTLCFELPFQPLKVGRAPDCDIRINDRTVSRDHLRLEPVEPRAWRARAASATNPTLLRGDRLTASGELLQAGDELGLGEVLLSFQSAEGMGEWLERLR